MAPIMPLTHPVGCTCACEHESCGSKHTSRAALRSTGPGPPLSRPSRSEEPRAELAAGGWNVPCAKWYAARWNAWNASIVAHEADEDRLVCGEQEDQEVSRHATSLYHGRCADGRRCNPMRFERRRCVFECERRAAAGRECRAAGMRGKMRAE